MADLEGVHLMHVHPSLGGDLHNVNHSWLSCLVWSSNPFNSREGSGNAAAQNLCQMSRTWTIMQQSIACV